MTDEQRLARKEAGEEIAQAIEAKRGSGRSVPIWRIADLPSPYEAYTDAARIARDIATKEPS